MTKQEPSQNFKALLHVINDTKSLNLDEYISCLAFLPNIRTDIQFLFDDLCQEGNVKDQILMVISKIFSKRNPADFNFSQDELIPKINSLILMKQELKLFKDFYSYFQILNLLLPLTRNNHEALSTFTSLMNESINKKVVYSSLAMVFDQIRDEAFEFLVRSDGYIRNASSLFSLANLIPIYRTLDNIPQNLKEYIKIQNVTDYLMPVSQIAITDQSNKNKNANESAPGPFDDSSYNLFILYFLTSIQKFYPSVQAISVDSMYSDMFFKIMKENDYLSILLLTRFMVELPSTNEIRNFGTDNQISFFLAGGISKYIVNFESEISKNILKFVKDREDTNVFINTMINMPTIPELYRAAIFLGLNTNMFSNQQFVNNCFPAKVTKTEFFIPILSSLKYLNQRSFIQKANVSTILTTIYSILSHKEKFGNVLKATLEVFEGMISSNFTSDIFYMTIANSPNIHVSYLIPIVQLLISKKDAIPNQEISRFVANQTKAYFKCVAVVARLIEIEDPGIISDQEKLILLNFLNFLNGSDISQPPENNKKSIEDYWCSMRNKFTILNLMKDYVWILADSDQYLANLIDDFTSVVSDLFDKNEKFTVVVSLLPLNTHTAETIRKAKSIINLSQSYKNDFVSFYTTRIYISPKETLETLKTIVDYIDKNQLLPEILNLIRRLSHQLVSYEDYMVYSTCNRRIDDKEREDKQKECDVIYKSLGKFIEKLKYYKKEKKFMSVQVESRAAVYEVAKNPNIKLSDNFIKEMINIPFFYNSFSFLLRKLSTPTNIDAKYAALAWVKHLHNHDHDHFYNKEIAFDLLSTIADNKQKVITVIVSTVISNTVFQDDDDENKDSFAINDSKAYGVINFLEYLAINGCSKTYAYSNDDPQIIIYFSRFCFSKKDNVRESAFRFIINYFAITLPFVDRNSSPQHEDPLCFYKEKHTRSDRILVFLSLFNRVFAMRKVLAREVFKAITKQKTLRMYHILLCKSIVLTNFVESQNYLNFNINIDTDAVNNNYNYNYYNQMNNPTVNYRNYNPNMNMNHQINNPTNNFNPDQNLNSNYMTNIENDSIDQLTNDELIPDGVLFNFCKTNFATPKVLFEAQEVVKLMAVKDIDKFINFTLEHNSNIFIECVVRRIMYSIKYRNKFIDSFISYILRGGVRIGSNKELNENDIKVTDAEVSFLKFIISSDNSGELICTNCGKLLLIIVMLVGISNCSRKRTDLKKNTKLSEIFSLVTSFSNYENRKQIDNKPTLIRLDTDNDDKFSNTLSLIAHELMNLEISKFREFCICCKNSVKLGANCVASSIGIIMMHLGSAFSQYGSPTAAMLTNDIWSVVAEAILKCNLQDLTSQRSPKYLRLFAHELNKLTDPIIIKISPVNINHMLVTFLDSLSDNLDNYKADVVEIFCRLLENSTNLNSELREKIIINLQHSINLTTAEQKQRNKDRQKFKKKCNELFIKPPEKEKPHKKEARNSDINESYDPNASNLDQKVLRILKHLISKDPNGKSIFGSWKTTKLSNVDVAEKIAKGNQAEQGYALDIFKELFNVHTDEDVAKKFIIMFNQEDFNELCERLVYVDIDEIDVEWFKMLVWIYQSFRNHGEIDPMLKQRFFSLALEISCKEGHVCRESALRALNLFSK